jgi:hypothetical protein
MSSTKKPKETPTHDSGPTRGHKADSVKKLEFESGGDGAAAPAPKKDEFAAAADAPLADFQVGNTSALDTLSVDELMAFLKLCGFIGKHFKSLKQIKSGCVASSPL